MDFLAVVFGTSGVLMVGFLLGAKYGSAGQTKVKAQLEIARQAVQSASHRLSTYASDEAKMLKDELDAELRKLI